MSIPEIGTWFEFVGAELVENSNMRPLSDWENGDKLQVVAHVNMQGDVNPLYWNSRDLSSSTVREDLLEIIPATKPQPKPWSGPEDGLPPVGTVCEYQTIGATNDWQEVEILCHFTAQKEVAVFVPVKGYRNVKQAIAECFRPIQTPEQLASEKRETAIREFMDVVGIDCRVTASKAVDAGFKREVV